MYLSKWRSGPPCSAYRIQGDPERSGWTLHNIPPWPDSRTWGNQVAHLHLSLYGGKSPGTGPQALGSTLQTPVSSRVPSPGIQKEGQKSDLFLQRCILFNMFINCQSRVIHVSPPFSLPGMISALLWPFGRSLEGTEDVVNTAGLESSQFPQSLPMIAFPL